MRVAALTIPIALIVSACGSTNDSNTGATVQQLGVGDAHCPFGGVAITANGTTAYACNGAPGQAGSAGATGPQGPQGLPGAPGPVGGGLYTSRDAVYCNTVTGISDTSGSLTAFCNTTRDLPLSGSCESGDDRIAVVIATGPALWEGANSTNRAAWDCLFGKNGVIINTPYAGARATICCVRNP